MKAIYADGRRRGSRYLEGPDDDTTNSAKGLLRVEKEAGDYVFYNQQSLEEFEVRELMPVFRKPITLKIVVSIFNCRCRTKLYQF